MFPQPRHCERVCDDIIAYTSLLRQDTVRGSVTILSPIRHCCGELKCFLSKDTVRGCVTILSPICHCCGSVTILSPIRHCCGELKCFLSQDTVRGSVTILSPIRHCCAAARGRTLLAELQTETNYLTPQQAIVQDKKMVPLT
ncbi:hypothetical protein J6590_059258 [Homalodisca vitripennis]|nr:hypothetical protein J6590_059258 [Homalodisca vitripennis]